MFKYFVLGNPFCVVAAAIQGKGDCVDYISHWKCPDPFSRSVCFAFCKSSGSFFSFRFRMWIRLVVFSSFSRTLTEFCLFRYRESGELMSEKKVKFVNPCLGAEYETCAASTTASPVLGL